MADAGGSSNVISLPKGGGALRGIGEKFSPDLHTGSGNFTGRLPSHPAATGSSRNSASYTALARAMDRSAWAGASAYRVSVDRRTRVFLVTSPAP
jgi:hypothetical protein